MNSKKASEIQRYFVKEFELCKLREDESVVIVTEPGSNETYVSAAFGGALEITPNVFAMTLPSGGPSPYPSTHTGAGPGLVSLMQNKHSLDCLKSADFIIDLTLEGFIHAPIQNEILKTGTRILFICDPAEVLIRNMPQASDKERVERGKKLLSDSKTMRVTSGHGTDLVVDLEDCHPMFQVGFADDPGRWDHWPSTMVMCWPHKSDGVIVLAPGDFLLPFKDMVQEEVEITVKEGMISDIDGGYEATLMRYFMDDSGDKWARYLSHMGWGLMKSANWFSALLYSKGDFMGMDARAFAGNFLWSTGPHPFMDRPSYAHLDIAMRGCSISVDEETIVEKGKLVFD